jgi:rhamnose utilization protein RhaD (predicted bifunctional aldolase and dehydrogenase)/NAD(P)-dependent dehydrogenase (short-subunit alcohol dehydrogenase family)
MWNHGLPAGSDALEQVVHLSHLIGADRRLVQPGGGNTSVKVRVSGKNGVDEERLLVKGSGTDLRTIGRTGFAPLSLAQLAELREREAMTDEEMMAFMAHCMLDPSAPTPSVETPLHSILPYTVIAHTHDVATMSLTNLDDAVAQRLIREIFEDEIFYTPYVRPGFPLARVVSQIAGDIPPNAIGMTLAHHGLVVWGEHAEETYQRLRKTVHRIDEYLATCRRGKRVLGDVITPDRSPEQRRARALSLLPVIRGALGPDPRVILHFDDRDEIRSRLTERFREASRRGMTTPEHVLRAGRLPVWLDLDLEAPEEAVAQSARDQLAAAHEQYLEYHTRRERPDVSPLSDWAKVVLIPGLGMVTAFKDKTSAVTANICYRAGMESIENAEAVGGFRFLSDEQVFEFEYWPLERRKVDAAIERELAQQLLPRHVVVVIGAASGIGLAAARRFAEEGANVLLADVDDAAAHAAAEDLATKHSGKVIAAGVDVRDDASITDLMDRAVLEFGGLDGLFYTAGRAPRFASVLDVERNDLVEQLEIHYLGAVMAVRAAGRIMTRQGLGGSIIASVSKAALAPGRDAIAYGGSKAALMQALRVAALELGGHGIRVNAINADQIDTPMFRRFVEERARGNNLTVEEQLERYRRRNIMGVSLIPADAVADMAVLLASKKFAFTTGDILTIDGGLPDAFPR